MSVESSQEVVKGWILKHACKCYMVPVVKYVLFGKNGSDISSGVTSSQLLSQTIPGNSSQIQPLLALMFLRSAITNLKSPSVHEDVQLLRTVIEILEELTFCFNDNSIKFVLHICLNLKIMIVIQYIRDSNPATIKILNDYFPRWSTEYENKLKVDFKMNKPAIMRKFRHNVEKSRKFLLSFIINRHKLEERYRSFTSSELESVSKTLYKQFIILWFEIIENVPPTEIEQIMNSKWPFDTTDDPAILILLECLRFNDKTVPTIAIVEKALLAALELLDRDGATPSLSEMFTLNLTGSNEPVADSNSAPIVLTSDSQGKELPEMLTVNYVNPPSPDIFLEHVENAASQRNNGDCQELPDINIVDEVQNPVCMEVDVEKDDVCIILSSESESGFSNNNHVNDKSSFQQCTTCESVSSSNNHSTNESFEQSRDFKAPSNLNTPKISAVDVSKVSSETNGHSHIPKLLPCLKNFLMQGDVRPCLIKLFKNQTITINGISHDIFA